MKTDTFSVNQFVAVYGTLKKGFSNHRCLEGSQFIGEAKTVEKYPLHVQGLPFMRNEPGTGHNVNVEIYSCTPNTMIRLDRLEGHPDFYRRKETQFNMGDKVITAWVYFIFRIDRLSLKDSPMVETFTLDHRR